MMMPERTKLLEPDDKRIMDFQRTAAFALGRMRTKLMDMAVKDGILINSEICAVLVIEGLCIAAAAIVASEGALSAEKFDGILEAEIEKKKKIRVNN